MTLDIRDPGNRLSTVSEAIDAAFRFASRAIAESDLPTAGEEPLHCIVTHDPEAVIPEIGIGAYTDDDRTVSLALDPDNAAFHADLPTEFTAALAHECHHALRMRGPGYGESVGEAVVSEGLACHYELGFRAGIAPFYAQHLSAQQLVAAEAVVRDHWDETGYRQAAWFFGAEPTFLPKFAGYSVGFALVDAFVSRDGRSAGALVAEPAGSFRYPSRTEARRG